MSIQTLFSTRSLATLLTASVLSASALASSPVVVSSKIDTEGSVLGHIIIQSLEAAGIPTTNRLQLGGTPIMRAAITSGEIDLYPEYTGNGAFFFDEADSDVWKDATAAWGRVQELDFQANELIWLRPADANNTWAMSVRGDVARANELRTLDDLAAYLANGGTFKFAASAEFVDSASALPAFQEAYGFTLSADQLLVLSGGNTAATMRAAAQQTSGVNGAMTYGTDGGLAALDLLVLEDTRGVQPVYQPAPLIRADVLAAYPQIAEVLEPVFAGLSLEILQRLNGDVAVNGADPQQVARDYLNSLR
ncbi:ABC transporter substrate-binding protein [Salinispirillum sp. LH 10-3-1]|uniref:ABC transporter substrate-binding protein n=1 Tax=Salinispirillum sp. LH 10-3-1 TaxID=2952525 RepID=A0AB38YGE4_9GAMM